MNLDGMRAFVAVAELASFTRAAEALHLAQPAVSQQVKRLERDLGVSLLTRSTRRVALTPAGERLLVRARSVLEEVSRAETEVQQVAGGWAGQVSVGFVGTATYDLLPRVVRRVRQELPDVELEVHGEQLSPDLREGLLRRRLDVVVMRDPQPDVAVDVHQLRSEPLVAVLPVDHPAAAHDSVALADLRDDSFVTHPSGRRSVMHAAVLEACRSVGFIPSDVIEVRETATLVAFVAAGIGVALVPEPVRSLALTGVAYRPVSDIAQRTDLVLATRAGERSPSVLRVADLVPRE
jgi:DNA-binding transcriptional LysR family regulator